MFQNSRTLDILLERFQCTPLGPKLTFWVFSHRFGALKSLFCFAPHTLRLKLMFWVVSRHFFAAPDSLWKSVSCALNARVYAPETISCFVATKMPNPLFQSKTHVLGGSMPFRSRTRYVAKTGIEADLMDDFMPLELFLVFLQQTCPIHYFRSKTHVLMVSRHFVATPNPWKLVSGCVQCTSLCLRNHFLFGHNEHAQSTTLGPKLILQFCLIPQSSFA